MALLWSQPAFAFRLAVYLILIGGCLNLLVRLPQEHGWKAILDEGGLIEILQASCVGVALAGLLLLAARDRAHRRLYVVLTALALLALLRELNHVPLHKWLLSGNGLKPAILGAAIALAVCGRRVLGPQLAALLRRPAAVLFVVGFLLITCWAQVLGQQQPFWIPLYGYDAGLPGKRLVEEGLELAGYLLICCALLEEGMALRARGRAASPLGTAGGVQRLPEPGADQPTRAAA